MVRRRSCKCGSACKGAIRASNRGLVLPCRLVKQFRVPVAGHESLWLLGVVVHRRFESSGLSYHGGEAQFEVSIRAHIYFTSGPEYTLMRKTTLAKSGK
jgi:hypothetical protein